MKYRKKPVVIDAVQWWKDGDHPAVELIWPLKDPASAKLLDEGCVGVIRTLEGPHGVRPGDWIITGVKGENYPCKPDIFEATYEAAE